MYKHICPRILIDLPTGSHRSFKRSARTQWLPMRCLQRHPATWWGRGTLSASAVPNAGAPPASWRECPLSTRKCLSRGVSSGESRGVTGGGNNWLVGVCGCIYGSRIQNNQSHFVQMLFKLVLYIDHYIFQSREWTHLYSHEALRWRPK